MTRRSSAPVQTLPAGIRLRFTLDASALAARRAADDYERQRRWDRHVLIFGTLLIASLLLTGWYGAGAGLRPGHGLLHAVLTAAWGIFYGWESLRRMPVVGPLLATAARLAAALAVALLFGLLYYRLLVA